MRINRFTIAALAVLLGTAPVLSQASDQPSRAWLEAKKVFAPINILRSSRADEDSESKPVTTIRVLDADGKKDLTVFPPLSKKANSRSFSVTRVRAGEEPHVTSVKVNGSKNAEVQASKTIVKQAPSSTSTELVLLPSVEPLPSSYLASSASNSQVSFATQAYMAEEQVSDQSVPEAGEVEYGQSEGSVEWSSPITGNCCASGCCDGCCDTCCSCCKPCCPCIMVAGVEAVFLNPDINGTPVAYVYDDLGAAPETVLFGPAFGQATMDDLYGAPRVWLGCQGCRWGIVGRYYQYMSNEHAHDFYDISATPPPSEHSFDVNNLLEAYYADIELTRNFCLHGCKSQLTFGARYARIEHHEAIYGRSNTEDGLLEAYARRNRASRGTGLTSSFNLRKPLFPCSCAHWYLNARTSILWGRTYNEVESEASVASLGPGAAVAAAGSIDGAIVGVDDDLFIGELQAGLQWDFALRCLPAKAFFRTAFEYQYWDAGLGGASSGSFAGVVDSGSGTAYQVAASSYAPGLVVDFVGFTIGSGFTW